MGQIEIKMLPIEQWQEVTIISFNYKYLAHPCSARIVYFFPMTLNENKQKYEIANKRIISSLENVFGEICVLNRSVIFDHVKEELAHVYANGRPKVDFVIRMIPEIPYEQYHLYEGKSINAYDFHLNIYLDYLGELDKYSDNLLITAPFTIESEEESIKWGADNVETL